MSVSVSADGPEKQADTAGSSSHARPKNVTEALKAKKEPPKEDHSSITRRRLVILSFWLLALLIGLPTWWKTTTVYRASLPLQRMHDWSEGKLCAPVYPLRVSLEAPGLQRSDAQHLRQSAQHALDDLNDFAAHHLRLSLPQGIADPGDVREGDYGKTEESSQSLYPGIASGDAAMTLKLSQVKTAQTPSASLRPHTNSLDITYASNMLPNSASSPSMLSSFIARELQDAFGEEQALLASSHGSSSRHLSPSYVETLAKRTTRSVKYAPTYHLTFSLFTPEAAPSGWDIETALLDTFAPLLEALSPISNFTIDTQVQPYAQLPPAIQPLYDVARRSWTLSEKDLGGFINTAEWPLSPSIGIGPTINFLLYIPSPAMSPLTVTDTSSNSWLVPQWGGVVIQNVADPSTTTTPHHLDAQTLRPALLAFSSQLMSLLGVPTTPPRSLPMRLSTLTRVRATTLFFTASSTLGSLARLVSTLPSISIPDSVASNVHLTLTHLEGACTAFRTGAFDEALAHAKAAHEKSEKAFFEKSMVGQVYFPDEHKVAVYLPLLGPVAVPLVVAGLREVKAVLQAWRAKRGKVKVG